MNIIFFLITKKRLFFVHLICCYLYRPLVCQSVMDQILHFILGYVLRIFLSKDLLLEFVHKATNEKPYKHTGFKFL